MFVPMSDMLTEIYIIILSVVALSVNTAIVDNLTICSVKNQECQKNMLQKILSEYGKIGIPEYNVPIFDPIILTDVSLPLIDLVNITLVEAKLKGLSSCEVNKFSGNLNVLRHWLIPPTFFPIGIETVCSYSLINKRDITTNIEKKRATLNITCDLTLKGNYKAFSNNPAIKTLLGGNTIKGDGKIKIKVQQINVRLDVRFLIENKNGDLYLRIKDDDLKYRYNVIDRVVFAANNLIMDGRDISETVTNLLNNNWKLVMQTVGDEVMKTAVDRAKGTISNIFDNLPTKYYIQEDLTPYVS